MVRQILIMLELTCPHCPGLKSEEAFELDNRYTPARRKVVCRTCVRKRQRARYAVTGRRSQAPRPSYYADRYRTHKTSVDELKQCPCVDCTKHFPAPCMEFDHVQSGKSSNIANMQNCKRQRVAAEVALCEVVCCNCHRVRTAKRAVPTTNNRLLAFRARMAELKAAPCSDCGAFFHHTAMDFDHVRGKKFKVVSAMWSYLWERVLEEIAKCDLVCANCHRLRTQARLEDSAKAA